MTTSERSNAEQLLPFRTSSPQELVARWCDYCHIRAPLPAQDDIIAAFYATVTTNMGVFLRHYPAVTWETLAKIEPAKLCALYPLLRLSWEYDDPIIATAALTQEEAINYARARRTIMSQQSYDNTVAWLRAVAQIFTRQNVRRSLPVCHAEQ